MNMLWRTLPKKEEEKTVAEARRYPSEPQENLLYFMEKMPRCWSHGNAKSCVLCARSASIFIRKNEPVMNEGWATFWHYTILNHLYDEEKSPNVLCWNFYTATPTSYSSRLITARGTAE